MGNDLGEVVGVEGSDKVVGVSCTDVRAGVFFDERAVQINGTDHFVDVKKIVNRKGKQYVEGRFKGYADEGKAIIEISLYGSNPETLVVPREIIC